MAKNEICKVKFDKGTAKYNFTVYLETGLHEKSNTMIDGNPAYIVGKLYAIDTDGDVHHFTNFLSAESRPNNINDKNIMSIVINKVKDIQYNIQQLLSNSSKFVKVNYSVDISTNKIAKHYKTIYWNELERKSRLEIEKHRAILNEIKTYKKEMFING